MVKTQAELRAGLSDQAIGPAVVRQLQPAPAAVDVFRRLSRLPHCLFLDSALADAQLGRYSFVCADPFDFIEAAPGDCDPLARLEQRLEPLAADTLPGLPPWQGGAAGLLGYELCHSLEPVPACRFDEFRVPVLAVGLYDVVVAFDHGQQRAWVISQGLPETEPARRHRRACQRADQFCRWIDGPACQPSPLREQHERRRQLAAGELAPQFPVAGADGLTSNFSRAKYLQTVRRAIEYIHAGDVFQVNLAQRLLCPARTDAVSLYLRLRQRNPAPFAGYFDLGRYQVVSASPERFLSVRDGQVEARPIKGTRQRTRHVEADLFAGHELQHNQKDRAENVMIVDLLRNDLSRVCEPDSVCVTELCRLEVYAYVQHLVSVVRGKLADGCGPLQLVRAAFPGGSITGAPKVRAMQIIAELEPTARGPYCGSLGYIGFDGAMDLNILIRTITAGAGWWQLPVGGGIVAQSEPRREYEETWHKAKGLIKALR